MALFHARRLAKSKPTNLPLSGCNDAPSHVTMNPISYGAFMRHLPALVATLAFALLSTGCSSSHPPPNDIAIVQSYGGRVTPGFQGEFAGLPPMQAVDFSPERRLLTDDDFAALLPSLQRLQPYRIFISGQRISDQSIPLINKIPNLHVVAAEGTDITPEGHARIKPQGDAIERWFEGRVDN
jgi:hypothetical protein